MKLTDFFTFTGGSNPTITPECAILLHRGREIDGAYGNDYLASIHQFFVDGKTQEPVIGAGQLMTKEDLESIFRSLLQMRNRKATLLPNNVVSISDSHIAWTVPARVRPMLFNIQGVKMRKINVPWPRLLIVANCNGKMAVTALKGNRRPTGRTKLYHAPLMNVSSNGAVCTGSASVPLECGVEDIASWESVMFDTAFSHVNNPATFRLDGKKEITTKMNLRFWQSLSKQKAESFPNDRLLPMRNSLENFIGKFSV